MTLILHTVVFLSVALLGYWVLVPKKWRSIFLFGISIYFMSLFSIKFSVFFIFNAVLVYYAGKRISREEAGRILFLKLSLIWLIGSLCIFKYGHIVLNSFYSLSSRFAFTPEASISKIALPMGISYIIFRLIHYIVEVYRKSLPEHTFWDLAAYVFFFPTFIAGPVDRFQRFHPQTAEQKSFDPADINYGLYRIISGLLKKFVVADTLSPIIMPVLASSRDYSSMIVLLSVYGLAIMVYMDFSGYTDIAIGVSRLFGYKIMENFNYPFFKKNIALFWRNWHISVYTFIRDYFFYPFFAYRATQLKIYIGIFTTLMVFMLWHGLSASYLIIGAYHGLGMVVWQILQEFKGKHKRLRKMIDNKYVDPLSTFFTFNFVSFSVIVFYFDVGVMKNIMYSIFL